MKKETRRGYNSQRGGTDLALIMSFFALFLSIGAAFIYFSLYWGTRPIDPVGIFQKTFDSAASIKTYSAHVRVQPEGAATVMPMFEGDVFFDVEGSQTTATFDIPLNAEKTAPKVSLTTILSAGRKFVKFQSSKAGAVFPEDWLEMISEEDRPLQFQWVEKSNALLDVLQVFRGGKEYAVINGDIKKEKIGGIDEVHFALKNDPLKTLPDEAMKDFGVLLSGGQINVWAAQREGDLKEIRFSLDGYTVTVSIMGTNKPSEISIPKSFLYKKEWKEKQFKLSLPAEPITEVLIGSYGDIKKEYLEGIRSAVQKATGAKVTIMGSGAPLAQKPPLYDPTRQQFDADALFRSVEAASSKYGEKSRFIYVFGVDVYSPSNPDRRSAWYVEKFGSNTSLVSVFDLSKKSDTIATPASLPLVISRLQKISLHTLGTSVGFSFSSSSDNKKCVMYPAMTLAELDSEGIGYCSPEKETISKIFKK